jgi:Mn-dependent DtxR family transcriptional regulator
MTYEKSMLLEVISDTIENRILDFLLEGRGISYSKTDIADACEISRPTVYKILPKMLNDGTVKFERKLGTISLYRINEQNEKVKALFKLEEILLKESFDQIEINTVPSPSFW